jgi:hypothetical protein
MIRMPRLSVVLATDVYDTLRPVVSALQRQRLAAEIELVIVLPSAAQAGVPREELRAFAHAQVVAVDSVERLATARTAGIHAASAPIVFIGETHTYPDDGWADALLAPFDEQWTAVVPAISNANPATAASWAAYLFDYARWGPSRSAGEMSDPLVYNTAYRRSALLALGDRLPDALEPHREVMWPLLWASGHRALFAPAARIAHVNIGRLGWLLQEKFCSGVVLGMRRSGRWRLWRRLLYLLASPLIPIVLLARVARDARPPRATTLPAGTIPALVLCALVKTLGEVVGYLGIVLPARVAQLTRMEIHKVDYSGQPVDARTPPLVARTTRRASR